jgi:hypothetical protein
VEKASNCHSISLNLGRCEKINSTLPPLIPTLNSHYVSGSLLVSDDFAYALYRIAYAGGGANGNAEAKKR